MHIVRVIEIRSFECANRFRSLNLCGVDFKLTSFRTMTSRYSMLTVHTHVYMHSSFPYSETSRVISRKTSRQTALVVGLHGLKNRAVCSTP